MKDDYLWDRTGEPDPEIQQLEEILGNLRYQPRALEIPADVEVGGKRNLFRSFRLPVAIAAGIALLLFGAALWFGLQRLKNTSEPSLAKNPDVAPSKAVTSSSPEAKKEIAVNQDDKETPVEKVKQSSSPHSLVAGNKNRIRKATPNRAIDSQQLAINRQEAQAAKDQLFLALRVTSTKLNFAQRKTQGPNSKDIHNQHRIG